MDTYEQYFGLLEEAIVIPFLRVNPGTPVKDKASLESAIRTVVARSNRVQKDIIFDLHIINDVEDGSCSFSLLAHTSSGYNEETIKAFFYSQAMMLISENNSEKSTFV